MRSEINTMVSMAFYSKDEQNIMCIRELLVDGNVSTLSELLQEFAPLDAKHQLFNDGKLYYDNLHILTTKGYYFLRINVDFEGLSNLRLASICRFVLNKRFGEDKVKAVYLDESALVNSDEQCIIFDTRVRIDYNIYERKNIRTEYYTSNQDLINSMKSKNIFLDQYFDIADEYDRKELIDIFKQDEIFINITYYDFEYQSELSNNKIQEFLNKY